MRNFIYITALSISLWSCGGGGGSDTPPPPPENKAPTAPILVYPTDNLLCINNVLDFQWNVSTDPDGDAITYQIEVSTNAQFTALVHNVTATSTLRTLSLEKGIAYYWRAKATDSKTASSNYSATNQFYTEGFGIVNHLPFSPILMSPALNKVVIPTDYSPTNQLNVILEWTASDVDTADTLTYDVYFGTSNPPTAKVAADQSTKTYLATLATSTTYYWKVVVKDGKGGQTIGQIWSFTTD
jgi:hypothetical protein